MSHIHRYQGNDITVAFDAELCIHTGDCSRALPAVFNVERRGRWIEPDQADADAVARVCAACPSGALRCLRRDTGELMHSAPEQNRVQVTADGPLYLHAQMALNGEPLPAYRAALCRCGASKNMPWCDNSHSATGFKEAGQVKVFNPDEPSPSGQLNIRTLKNGPLFLVGPQVLCDAAGHSARVSNKCALCRCGHSSGKPYCDGSHAAAGFKSD